MRSFSRELDGWNMGSFLRPGVAEVSPDHHGYEADGRDGNRGIFGALPQVSG